MREPITVDVVSDVVCPWCFLGKRRLEQAIALSEMPLAIRWRPFQLDPTIPPEGKDRRAYMEAKFGSMEKIGAIHAHITKLGAELGIPFAFDRIKVSPNTLDAHRLIRWAGEAERRTRSSRRSSAPTSSTGAISATRRCWRTSPQAQAWTARRSPHAWRRRRPRRGAGRHRRLAADRSDGRSDLYPGEPLRTGRRAAGRGTGAGNSSRSRQETAAKPRHRLPAPRKSCFGSQTGGAKTPPEFRLRRSVALRALDDDGLAVLVARVAIARPIGDVADDRAGSGACSSAKQRTFGVAGDQRAGNGARAGSQAHRPSRRVAHARCTPRE